MSEEPNPNAFADISKLLLEETPTPEPEETAEKKEETGKVEKPAQVKPAKKASKPLKPRPSKPESEGQLITFPKEFSEITTRLETELGEIKNLLIKKTEEKNLTTYEIEEIQTRALTPLEQLLKDYFESANTQLRQILETLPKESSQALTQKLEENKSLLEKVIANQTESREIATLPVPMGGQSPEELSSLKAMVATLEQKVVGLGQRIAQPLTDAEVARWIARYFATYYKKKGKYRPRAWSDLWKDALLEIFPELSKYLSNEQVIRVSQDLVRQKLLKSPYKPDDENFRNRVIPTPEFLNNYADVIREIGGDILYKQMLADIPQLYTIQHIPEWRPKGLLKASTEKAEKESPEFPAKKKAPKKSSKKTKK